MSKKKLKLSLDNYVHKEKNLEIFICDRFRAHKTSLKTLSLRLLKDEDYAEDIVQEVFIAFWEHRNKVDEINNIEAYLFRMTRNKIMDKLRKISADQRLKDQLWRSMSSETNDNTEKTETKELQEVLTQAIESLPPKRKQIYLLKNEDGEIYQYIATKMNISQHTVKNQLFSAVKTIRTFIKNRFGEGSTFIILSYFL